MTLQNLFADMEEVEQAKRDQQIETGKPYFTLVVYDTEYKQWINEFGDYDKECVADEMDEYILGYLDVKPKHVKILKTSDNQQAIDAAINKLNGVA